MRMRLERGLVSLAAIALLLAACGTSKVSQVGSLAPLEHQVRIIALAPSGGVLADAIGVELVNRGYNVVDTQETTLLLARMNLDEMEIMQPQRITQLRERGIDAVLAVRAAAGPDGRPQSASVRLNSTHNAKVIGGVAWQNGWGGTAGSMADRTMRKDVIEAAREIADVLVKAIRR